jgi:hypothetical protein
MSPGVLALFSCRGVDIVRRRKGGGGIESDLHQCSPRCFRHGCIWERHWGHRR